MKTLSGFIRYIAMLNALCICLTAAAAQQSTTASIVQAANVFLATLDAQQRQHVLYAFDDNQQRVRWSNLPIIAVPRGGISLKEMTPAQRSAAMALVAAALSPRGFEKVQQIMEGDEALKTLVSSHPPGGDGGPPPGPPPNGGNRVEKWEYEQRGATCRRRHPRNQRCRSMTIALQSVWRL